MSKYVLDFNWPQGSDEQFHAEGDNLAELQQALAEQGYAGPTVAVTDDTGSIKGWVSAEKWRYQ